MTSKEKFYISLSDTVKNISEHPQMILEEYSLDLKNVYEDSGLLVNIIEQLASKTISTRLRRLSIYMDPSP